MLERVTIQIRRDGFVLEGRLVDGTLNTQQWGHGEQSSPRLLGGQSWREFELSRELLLAIDQATLAAGRIVRHYGSGMYETMHSIVIDIGRGWVDCQVSGDTFKPTLLHYEWDENAQLKPIQVIDGEKDDVPEAYLTDFHDAAFGRIGLLSRVMAKTLGVVESMEDPETLRWA